MEKNCDKGVRILPAINRKGFIALGNSGMGHLNYGDSNKSA